MMSRSWGRADRWHELFDLVCIERGYLDNSQLATELCNATANRGQQNYEAALKNLGNWRRGLHVPSRKNLFVLTRLLGVDDDEYLREIWRRLYLDARKPEPKASILQSAIPAVTPVAGTNSSGSGLLLRIVSVGTFVGVAIILGTIGYLFSKGYYVSAAGIHAADVEYRKSVSLRIGESTVVHGARSACGEQAPEWKVVREKLPGIEIGTWSDGGEGRRYSRACGGPTPARGVVFTATAAGMEEITLYGDPVAIHVE